MKLKIDFQDGCYDGQLGFPIGTILAFFYLQVAPIIPAKFRVNWPFGSGDEAQNRSNNAAMVAMAAILDSSRNDLAIFYSSSHPNTFHQVSSQVAYG